MRKANWLVRLFGGAWMNDATTWMRNQEATIARLEREAEHLRDRRAELEDELEERRARDLEDDQQGRHDQSVVSAMEAWWESRPRTYVTNAKLDEALGPIGNNHPAWTVMLALIRDHEQSYRDSLASPQCAAVDFNRGAATALAHMAYTLERHRVAAQAAVEGK